MLSAKNLSKTYPENNIQALKDINLKINRGEIIGLLGPNGAGKSTFVSIVSGLISKDSGQVFIDDIELKEKNNSKIMAKLGVVLEGERNLYWALTVKNNLYYFATIKGCKRESIKESIKVYGNILEINSLHDRKVNSLSSGQKQRVAITAALLHNPELLLLDEPSNGLDIDSRSKLIEHLQYIKDKFNKTIIITSHNVDFLRRIVSRFVIINQGRIRDKFINDNLSTDEIERRYRDIINGVVANDR